ncbi:MAG TPA: ATP-dependent DNA ligase [Actinomycetota bacterium]|nr:ATP-dependent DNA ligase [Actinomycetota bacterium]
MTLPFGPPLAPMLARSQDEIPEGAGWRYEPKWDGYRAIVFRDGPDVHIGSRGEKPLHRYFPELLPVLRDALPKTCVLDGEIITPVNGVLEFDVLSQRIHPAASRIELLSRETPATFVAFDLLAAAGRDLRERPLRERWERLAKALADLPSDFDAVLSPGPAVCLTPQGSDAVEAARWLEDLAASGLDGIIAKREEEPYRPGERTMVKVKRTKTADVVIGGYRVHKSGEGVGSLLLGLYDDAGVLHHVGFSGAFPAKQRREMLEILRPLEGGDAFGPGAGPGGPSRWRQEERAWVPLEPKLVAEVAYDHVTGQRFRHGTRLLRWRDDKPPEACTLDQIRPG